MRKGALASLSCQRSLFCSALCTVFKPAARCPAHTLIGKTSLRLSLAVIFPSRTSVRSSERLVADNITLAPSWPSINPLSSLTTQSSAVFHLMTLKEEKIRAGHQVP